MSANAGFTSAAAPWLPVNPNYPSINVEAEEKDPQSLLHFYRRAIRLRKALPAVRYGRYREFYRLSDRLYVYSRESAQQRLLIICSFTEKPVVFRAPGGYALEKGTLLLCNYPDADRHGNTFTTRPYETRVYRFGSN